MKLHAWRGVILPCFNSHPYFNEDIVHFDRFKSLPLIIMGEMTMSQPHVPYDLAHVLYRRLVYMDSKTVI